MGCNCTKPVPYMLEKRLNSFKEIEQISTTSTPARIQEFKDCLVNGIMGSDTTAPEPSMVWLCDGVYSADSPFTSEHDIARRRAIEWEINSKVDAFLKRNFLFALIDIETFAIAAAVIMVNNTQPKKHRRHQLGVGGSLRTFTTHGTIPLKGEAAARRKALERVRVDMHQKHAPEDHWYVMNMATNPRHQRKGFGRKLLQFICKMMEADNCLAYLEACGERNVNFFKSCGFEVVESCRLEVSADSSTSSGGAVIPAGDMDGGDDWNIDSSYCTIMTRRR